MATKWLDIPLHEKTYDALQALGSQFGLSVEGTAKALLIAALLRKSDSVVAERDAVANHDEPVKKQASVSEKRMDDDKKWKHMIDLLGGPTSDQLPAPREVYPNPVTKTILRSYHSDDFNWQMLIPPNNSKPGDSNYCIYSPMVTEQG